MLEVTSQRSEAARRINSAKDLALYQVASGLQWKFSRYQSIFHPRRGMRFTTQIRSSSRSVCPNVREAWAKRRYEAHFIRKLTDSDGENSETGSSLDFAQDCKYISTDQHRALTSKCAEIGRMLNGMMKKSSSFLLPRD